MAQLFNKYFLLSLSVLNIPYFFYFNLFIARPTGVFRRLTSDAKWPILNFELITLSSSCALSSFTCNLLKANWLLFWLHFFSTAVYTASQMDAGLDKRGPLSISKVETQVRIRYFSLVTLNIYHKIAVIGCRPRISSFLERNQAFRTIVLPMKV